MKKLLATAIALVVMAGTTFASAPAAEAATYYSGKCTLVEGWAYGSATCRAPRYQAVAVCRDRLSPTLTSTRRGPWVTWGNKSTAWCPALSYPTTIIAIDALGNVLGRA